MSSMGINCFDYWWLWATQRRMLLHSVSADCTEDIQAGSDVLLVMASRYDTIWKLRDMNVK